MTDVRPDDLKCWLCHQWKMDRQFSRSNYRRRRNRNNRCKSCQKSNPYERDSFEQAFERILRAAEKRRKLAESSGNVPRR